MQGNNTIFNPLFFYTDVDKISDVLMHLGRDITLRFNVRLSHKSEDGTRRFNVSEVKYNVNKYSDTRTAVNIRRDIDFYFSLEHSNDLSRGAMLTISDIIAFKKLADLQITWWFDGDMVFKKAPDNRSLIVDEKHQDILYLNLSSQGKKLAFSPNIVLDPQGNSKKGLRMWINFDDNFVDLDVNRYYEFYYLLTNTDMYACACSMINFAKIQPYGATMLDKSTGYDSSL